MKKKKSSIPLFASYSVRVSVLRNTCFKAVAFQTLCQALETQKWINAPVISWLHKTTAPRFVGWDSRRLFCSQIRSWAGMSRDRFSWLPWTPLGSVPLGPRVVPAQALRSPELSAGAAHIFFPYVLLTVVTWWLHPKVDGRFRSLLRSSLLDRLGWGRIEREKERLHPPLGGTQGSSRWAGWQWRPLLESVVCPVCSQSFSYNRETKHHALVLFVFLFLFSENTKGIKRLPEAKRMCHGP